MKNLNFLFVFLIFIACSKDKQVEQALQENESIIGLNTFFQLGYGESALYLSDYCLDVSGLDSVKASSGIQIRQLDSVLIITQSLDANAMEALYLWKNGTASVIPVKRSLREKVDFIFNGHGNEFKSVQIKGSMNSWNVNSNEFLKEGGNYKTSFVLAPGDYQYKMVIDGKEISHDDNPDSISNGMGRFNQLLKVGSPETKELFIYAKRSLRRIEIKGLEEGVSAMALWNNIELPIVKEDVNYFIDIPSLAKDMKRSFIRVWAFDKSNISNDILIPLEYGSPLKAIADLVRSDKHALSLYNVFMDRFYDGDKSNNWPDTSGEVLPKANNMGGDIRGLIEKVDAGFFEELGVNTIWISPIVKNTDKPYGFWPDPKTKFSAYHGYWPVSFTLVDPRFGTAADLHELVDKAHTRNLNVLLDFVANHVHEEHPYYKAHPEVATDLYLPDGTLNTERWDDHRLTTWFDTFMPSLQLDKPEVYEMVSDSAVYWIEEYKLDGFRHDATKHVPEIFWRTLTRKLKERVIEKGTPIYQIGETYGTRELVASYVNSGQLDAQFDFNVYDACVSALVSEEGSFEDLSKAIKESLNYFGHHHLMGNITGNQDRARFISYAGGALNLSENAKKAGWTREVGVGDPVGYRKSKELMALVATLPGIPVIYYGDEIGSYGGNDPDNRKMMLFGKFAGPERDLRAATMDLLHFRNNSLPLIYGDFRVHVASQDLFVYSRNYLGRSVFIILNDSDSEQQVSFRPDADQTAIPEKTKKKRAISRIENHMISFKIPAHSFEIID